MIPHTGQGNCIARVIALKDLQALHIEFVNIVAGATDSPAMRTMSPLLMQRGMSDSCLQTGHGKANCPLIWNMPVHV